MNEKKGSIEPLKDGTYIVKGGITVANDKGETLSTKKVTSLCRCGQSSKKPFCDGAH